MSEDLRESQARAQEPAAAEPMSEPEMAIRRALYEISQQKGSGNWSLSNVEHILEQGLTDTLERN